MRFRRAPFCNLAWLLGLLAGLVLSTSAQTLTESHVLDFGDFQAKAVLTRPESQNRVPAVVLVHGSGPEDMDASITTYWGGQAKFHSAIFKQIAEHLPTQGVAVLRYNKHYVSGPASIDYTAYQNKLTLERLVVDVGVAVEFLRQHSAIDPDQIYLLGASEGSAVATETALRLPHVAGLVCLGTVILDWREGVERQIRQQGIPYLRHYSQQGSLSLASLWAALRGPGGHVEKGMAAYLTSRANYKAFDPIFDMNRDGILNIEDELVRRVEPFLDREFGPQGYFRMFERGKTLPTVGQQLQRLCDRPDLPILLLHGDNDANCPSESVRSFDAQLESRGHPAHATIIYPRTGHALGPAQSRRDDLYRPMGERALDDLADWLLHSSR